MADPRDELVRALDAAKRAQGFIGHGVMVLVHVLFAVREDQVGLKFLAKFQEVFQDFLPRIGEDARREGT